MLQKYVIRNKFAAKNLYKNSAKTSGCDVDKLINLEEHHQKYSSNELWRIKRGAIIKIGK